MPISLDVFRRLAGSRRGFRAASSLGVLSLLASSLLVVNAPAPAGASHDPTAAPVINITKIGFGTDGGTFDFTIDPAVAPADAGGAFTIDDAETVRFEGLTVGTAYTITEPAGPDSIVCDEAADAQPVGTNAVTITPTAGQLVNCTFTNPPPPGHTGTEINITKVVEGALDGDFAITVAGATATDFTLNDRETFTIVNPVPDANGNFTVTEVLPEGGLDGSMFEFVGVSCNVTPFNFDQLPNAFVTFLIPAPEPGEAVNCTIVNRRPEGEASVPQGIQMVKQVTGGPTDPGRFNLLIDGEVVAAAVGSGAFTPFIEVSPGPHVVSETAAEGTDLADYTSSVVCSEHPTTKLPFVIAQNLSSSTVTVNVSPFVLVDCVITNHPVGLPPLPGQLQIEKLVEGPRTNVAFPFASDLDGDFGNGADFTLEGGDAFNTLPIPPGVYSVVELVPPGWELASAVCSDGSPADAIELSTLEFVVCFFTNRRAGEGPYGGNSQGLGGSDVDTPYGDAGDTRPAAPAPSGDVTAPDVPASAQAGVSAEELAVPATSTSAPASDVAPVALAWLPRTGGAATRLALVGLLLLGVGGLAGLAGRARRRRPARA